MTDKASTYPLVRSGQVGQITYEIYFNNVNSEFDLLCPVISTINGESIQEVEALGRASINTWLQTNPDTFEGWYKLFTDCMVWSGYEDCELDERLLKDVANRYAKYVNTIGSKDNA